MRPPASSFWSPAVTPGRPGLEKAAWHYHRALDYRQDARLLLWATATLAGNPQGLPIPYRTSRASGNPERPRSPYRHSRASGNPERYCQMMPQSWQVTAGFPLTRE